MHTSNSATQHTSGIRPNSCGICKQSAGFLLRENFKEYSLWHCPRCDGQFWFPMQNPGAQWYAHDDRYAFRNRNPLRSPERTHRAFLADRPAAGGRLLDVGTGTGNFLVAARAAGYRAVGTDFDLDAVKTATEQFGLSVYPLDLAGVTARFGKESFDVITLFEVLEHLEAPRTFLDEVGALLAPGGYLAITVPYRGCPAFLKPHDLPPRHLTRWNETAMENLLTAAGFSMIRLRRIPLPFSYLITKFHFWTKGFFSFGAVQRFSRGAQTPGQRGAPREKTIATMQLLARIKDYALFTIPAALLYGGLLLLGRRHLGLYALARRYPEGP